MVAHIGGQDLGDRLPIVPRFVGDALQGIDAAQAHVVIAAAGR
jgi:hypothetical protein